MSIATMIISIVIMVIMSTLILLQIFNMFTDMKIVFFKNEKTIQFKDNKVEDNEKTIFIYFSYLVATLIISMSFATFGLMQGIFYWLSAFAISTYFLAIVAMSYFGREDRSNARFWTLIAGTSLYVVTHIISIFALQNRVFISQLILQIMGWSLLLIVVGFHTYTIIKGFYTKDSFSRWSMIYVSLINVIMMFIGATGFASNSIELGTFLLVLIPSIVFFLMFMSIAYLGKLLYASDEVVEQEVKKDEPIAEAQVAEVKPHDKE